MSNNKKHDKQALQDALVAALGNKVSLNPNVLAAHGRDESYHTPYLPNAVVFAEQTQDVVTTLQICRELKAPLIPFGIGSSLEGHVGALTGGVSLDLSGMTRLLEVNAEDMDCRVEAGIDRVRLNEELRDTGLFFPIDPGAPATLGGMAATRASGTNAVKFGTMRDNVLGLTVVTANGEVMRTGTRAPKSSAGYDLVRLFIGSEGTLGVITELQLKLAGQPEAVSAAVVQFDAVEGATQSAILVKQMGVPVARMEFLDARAMGAVNAFSKLDYAEKPTLFFEFHGTEAWVEEQARLVEEITETLGGSDFRWARRQEDRNAIWRARHDAYYAQLALRPGMKGITTDVCVPISRLADCIEETMADIEPLPFPAPIVGHVGDGNFHCLLVVDVESETEMRAAKDFSARLVERALRMGGTCTGEHGVGHGKLAYMEQEHDAASLAMMRTLKQALDPEGLMNPGKLIPGVGEPLAV